MTDVKKQEKRLKEVTKKVTASSEAARAFLKTAGIMTSQGNLSPKYR